MMRTVRASTFKHHLKFEDRSRIRTDETQFMIANTDKIHDQPSMRTLLGAVRGDGPADPSGMTPAPDATANEGGMDKVGSVSCIAIDTLALGSEDVLRGSIEASAYGLDTFRMDVGEDGGAAGGRWEPRDEVDVMAESITVRVGTDTGVGAGTV
jgi:hypothetical protein